MTHATMCNGSDGGHGCFVPWCNCTCHRQQNKERVMEQEKQEETEFERGVRAGVENMTMFFQDEHERSIYEGLSDDHLARHAKGAIQQALLDEKRFPRSVEGLAHQARAQADELRRYDDTDRIADLLVELANALTQQYPSEHDGTD